MKIMFLNSKASSRQEKKESTSLVPPKIMQGLLAIIEKSETTDITPEIAGIRAYLEDQIQTHEGSTASKLKMGFIARARQLLLDRVISSPNGGIVVTDMESALVELLHKASEQAFRDQQAAIYRTAPKENTGMLSVEIINFLSPGYRVLIDWYHCGDKIVKPVEFPRDATLTALMHILDIPSESTK